MLYVCFLSSFNWLNDIFTHIALFLLFYEVRGPAKNKLRIASLLKKNLWIEIDIYWHNKLFHIQHFVFKFIILLSLCGPSVFKKIPYREPQIFSIGQSELICILLCLGRMLKICSKKKPTSSPIPLCTTFFAWSW